MPVIIDSTRMPPTKWKESLPDLVGRITELFPADDRSVLLLVHRDAQVGGIAGIPADSVVSITDVAPDEETADVVRARAETFLDRSPDHAKLHVVTFTPIVRETIQALAASYTQGRLETVLVPPPDGFAAKDPAATWPSSEMPHAEALNLLEKALRSVGGRTYRSNIRPQLTKLDPRFALTSNTWAAGPSIITALLDLGFRRGLIEFEGPDPATQKVRLLKDLSVGDQERPGGSAAATPALKPPATHDDKTRSEQFVTLLRQRAMGPFMTVRLAVYDAIDGTLSSPSVPLPLREIVSEGVASARELGIESKAEFPWSRVKAFVERLLSRVPVAQDSAGASFLFTWQTSGTEVTRFDDDWQLKLDGELVLELLTAGESLDLGDVPDIAGAMFNGRDEEKLERVYRVVETLVAADKVTEDGTRLVLPGTPSG